MGKNQKSKATKDSVYFVKDDFVAMLLSAINGVMPIRAIVYHYLNTSDDAKSQTSFQQLLQTETTSDHTTLEYCTNKVNLLYQNFLKQVFTHFFRKIDKNKIELAHEYYSQAFNMRIAYIKDSEKQEIPDVVNFVVINLSIAKELKQNIRNLIQDFDGDELNADDSEELEIYQNVEAIIVGLNNNHLPSDNEYIQYLVNYLDEKFERYYAQTTGEVTHEEQVATYFRKSKKEINRTNVEGLQHTFQQQVTESVGVDDEGPADIRSPNDFTADSSLKPDPSQGDGIEIRPAQQYEFQFTSGQAPASYAEMKRLVLQEASRLHTNSAAAFLTLGIWALPGLFFGATKKQLQLEYALKTIDTQSGNDNLDPNELINTRVSYTRPGAFLGRLRQHQEQASLAEIAARNRISQKQQTRTMEHIGIKHN